MHNTDSHYSQFTDEQTDQIKKCLLASVNGPYFEDWEFGALFGLDREEVNLVAKAWPTIEHLDPELVRVALINSLNNLLGYPHNMEEQLLKETGCTDADIYQLLKLVSGKTGDKYFDFIA